MAGGHSNIDNLMAEMMYTHESPIGPPMEDEAERTDYPSAEEMNLPSLQELWANRESQGLNPMTTLDQHEPMMAQPMSSSQGWGVQAPDLLNEESFPTIPPEPSYDYTMGQQLMHALRTHSGDLKKWWREKGPKLTKTSKGYLPDGSEAY